MEWIANQPVYFGVFDECSGDEIPSQLLDNTDISQVQFKIAPCSSAPQLMPDPYFATGDDWVLNDNWSIVDNMMCCSGDSTDSTATVAQFDATKYYQFNITVYSLSVGGQLDVYLTNPTTGKIGTITSTGTFTFYGFPVPWVFGITPLIIQPTANTSSCISEVTTYEVLTNAIIPFYLQDGTYQNEISYANNPDKFTFSKDTVTISIDWSELDLSNGCYYMCLLDPCENTNGQNYPPIIQNGDFSPSDDTTPFWTLGDDWLNTPPMTGVYALGGALVQENVFNNYTNNYCVTVTSQNLTGFAAAVNVYFGTNLVGQIIDNGANTFIGNCEGNFSLSFTLSPSTYVELLSVVACPIETDSYECNLTSNLFSIGDRTNECTLVVNACNNSDGLGFEFESSGFTPRVRLEAKFRQAKYTNERSSYTNSKGTKRNYYFTGRKSKNFCTDLQPEYIHDFLRLLLGFDNVYVNNVSYVVDDDEYNVEYPTASDTIGTVRLLMSEKTQNVKTIKATSVENVCILPPNYLLRADNLNEYVVQTTGDEIIISG